MKSQERKTEYSKIKDTVISVLNEYPEALANDNVLLAIVLKRLFNTSDLSRIALVTTSGICETITRARRKAQRDGSVKTLDHVALKRNEKEKEMREWLKS